MVHHVFLCKIRFKVGQRSLVISGQHKSWAMDWHTLGTGTRSMSIYHNIIYHHISSCRKKNMIRKSCVIAMSYDAGPYALGSLFLFSHYPHAPYLEWLYLIPSPNHILPIMMCTLKDSQMSCASSDFHIRNVHYSICTIILRPSTSL